tara:strand:- start:8539 stop:9480 length:942 start_codon:yes stop_codon:yes gene_type:complete
MARHLMIGDDAAVSYSSGVLADNALDVQKRSASGWTSLTAGDTVADSAEIRIVQGNGTTNIVSPWFYGKDVINWSGKSYSAAAAQTSTLLCVTTAAATVGGKELDIKFVYLNGSQQDFFSFSTTIVSGSVVADSGAAIIAAFNALTNVPDWLNPTATLATATVTFTGSKRGDTCQSGNTWNYEPVVFKTIIALNPVTTQTYTIVDNVVDATPGYGDGFAVKALEDSLMGNQYGYYNRVQQPNTPTTTADTGETYDMYNIVATKDGSSSSQINGVDNLIEITIAFDNDTGSLTSALEGVLNPYMNSAGFGSVNL